MIDRVSSATPRTAASASGQNHEAPRPAAASPSPNPAALTPAAVPNASVLTAEARLGGYPRLGSPGSGRRGNSRNATRRPQWPQRCERALLHYLNAQQDRDFVPELTCSEVDGVL